MSSAYENNNETVHVSFGNDANYITSHLLNLQGLAATSSCRSSDGGTSQDHSLCDPSVTHDVCAANSDSYATHHCNGARNDRYIYVPRTLIVDGRDTFASSWGDVRGSTVGECGEFAANNIPADSQIQEISTQQYYLSSWGGAVSIWKSKDISEFSNLENDSSQGPSSIRQDPNSEHICHGQHHAIKEQDPLQKFRTAASVIGLSTAHSRFTAEAPRSYNSGFGAYDASNRHVNWDEEGEGEEDEDDNDGYCYGEDRELLREEKRRQLERKNQRTEEMRKNWNDSMEDAWEEAFYRRAEANTTREADSSDDNHDNRTISPKSKTATQGAVGSNSDDVSNQNNRSCFRAVERDIHWNDYWLPPRPPPSKYQVALPFDTLSPTSNPLDSKNNSSWSSSFAMGYQPSSGGMGGVAGGSSGSNGISQYWRENALSEALRKVLEGCDVVKGFNIFVDGGKCDSPGSVSDENGALPYAGYGRHKHAKNLSKVMAGGGFHAGLATSFMEELHEECRSAGRWAVLVDPLALSSNDSTWTEGNHVDQFRRSVNAGLALHGLSTNSDAFLPLSIEGAYRAFHGDPVDNTVSQNRRLFEGSAAIAMALEASSLFYRLRRHPSSQSSNSSGARSRLGIQSGFYQGHSGNADYEDNDGRYDPFATASALTYHEFLACARPSSDTRRSILELDVLLRPLSFSSAIGQRHRNLGDGVGSLLAVQGGNVSSQMMSLALAGIIGNGGTGSNGYLGELHRRMMAGTSMEKMKIERDQQYSRYSRSRGNHFSKQQDPGEWLEDISTNAGEAGGVLSSISGSIEPFGRRSSHHHFALSASLRPAASDRLSSLIDYSYSGKCASAAYLRPIMEGLGVKYRPEVSLGLVVRDTVVDLTNIGSYWRSVFSSQSIPSKSTSTETNNGDMQNMQGNEKKMRSALELATNTPILSVLGNSTRSYRRLSNISSNFVDALRSRTNMGYFSRDVMAGLLPEKDDCEEALEYCRELVDVYEPPLGSGLVNGEDENDDMNAYFDED
ncbi:hypothetical protein ACHAXS_006543 [Conticribra weissflogii]